MSDQRRYGDEEVEEIFDRASRSAGIQRFGSGTESGLTLEELQEVGREVGLDPEKIATAAAALERIPESLPAPRTHFGVPMSVRRVVELPRAPTDHEWELLVVELRATFGAKGTADSSGGLREWSNGNLHAYIEPTETGYRLRLGTVKGGALFARRMGPVGLAFAAFLAPVMVGTGNYDALAVPLLLAVAGIVAIASPRFTLPSWAREREQQMEYIGQRATGMLAGEPRQAGATDHG